jgi:hypothetical protein
MAGMDGYRPTLDELRKWAFDVNAMAPQDWDLVISCDPKYDNLFLELAADNRCPKCGDFLSVLYIAVGDAVRYGFGTRTRESTEGLIAMGDRYTHPEIQKWQLRSRNLIEHPATFDYWHWCRGGFLLEDLWPESESI